MGIEKLEWDSAFLGIKTGKFIINENDFNPLLFKKEAKDNNYELIYLFKYQTILSNEYLIKGELDLMDIQLTMSKKFNKNEYLNLPFEFRTELSEKEINECYKIAEETSNVSRFFKEIKIGKHKTKELYRKWIDNALNKSFSDGLFIEKESNTVSGIHLIRTNEIEKIGYFTLTGVHPNFKRKGIGKKLWMQSFCYWANECDIEIIKSPFSLQNAESFNFHLKMGFNKVEEIKYIYHYRNKIL